MLDLRDQFAALVAEHDGMGNTWTATLDIHLDMEDEILATMGAKKLKLPPAPQRGVCTPENIRLYSERWTKLRAAAHKKLGEEKLREIVGQSEAKVTAMHAAHNEQRAQLVEKLSALAKQLTPRPGPTWVKAAERSELDYSSQSCAKMYARTSAELHALDYIVAGLEAEVRVRPRKLEIEHPAVYRSGAFEVWVQTDELDLDIVKFGDHGMSMREWLEQVMARSMNPRVLSLGLPWGLEEKLGVTYDSSKLRPVRVVEGP